MEDILQQWKSKTPIYNKRHWLEFFKHVIQYVKVEGGLIFMDVKIER